MRRGGREPADSRRVVRADQSAADPGTSRSKSTHAALEQAARPAAASFVRHRGDQAVDAPLTERRDELRLVLRVASELAGASR